MNKIISSKSAKIASGLVGVIAGFAMVVSTASAYTFSTNLKQGSTGADVKNLQIVLNMSADTKVDGIGAGSAGKETSYFGPATKAAVINFQNKYASEVLAPAGLTSGTGFVGAMTRAKLNTMGGGSTTGMVPGCTSLVGFSSTTGQSCATGATISTVPGCTSVVGFSPTTGQKCDASTTTTTTGVATGAGFNVTLASDSPMSGALVAGQALGDLAHLTFSNNSGSEVKVTSITLNRTGVSNDDTLVNVYLYDGANRLTDSTSVSSGKATFNSSTGIFTIAAGSSKTIKVLGDILSTSAGQIVGVSLTSVTSTGTLTTTLPVNGGYLNIASATLGTLAFSTATTPTATSVDPQNDYTVWQNTVTVGTHALNLKALSLRNVGSINTSDIKNFRLYVDGSLLSTVANLDSNGYVTFDLSAAPKSLATGGRIIKVVADITGGSTRTFAMSLRQASDVTAVDSDLNQAVLATGNDTSSTGTFAARSATSATITAGSLSVTKAASSPSSDIAVASSNVKLGSFEFRAAGENIKIENLNVQADTSIHNGGLDNGKVFFNGVQVGSTKDLSEGASVNFTFGSSLIVNAGTTGIIDIYADAKTSTGTNLSATETILVTVAVGTSGNAQGMSSLNTLTVPATAVAANTITVAASTLTTTKYSGYGNQTMVAGRNNAKIGSFVLSAGSSEGVNVDTLTIALSTANAASLTNLTLKDAATGAQIGTVKTTPGAPTNAFGVNLALAASQTKTIDIYADILTAANAGTIAAGAAATGTGTLGTSVTASNVTLQTITVGNGSLTLAVAANNPTSANVIAGSTNVKVGQFVFTAANDSYTIEKLKIKVSNNAATSTTGITLKYKNAAGVEQTVSQPLTTGSESNATATFDGLTMYVPSTGTDALLDVYVDIPTIASGATSGAAITVTIDYNEGYQQKNSAGTTATTIGSADVTAASGNNGTFYVRKTVPTFARVTSGLTSVPTTGQALYKFSLTADTASSVEFKKITLTVATTSVTIADMHIREAGSSTDLNTTAANATTAGLVAFTIGTTLTDDIQQIGAGSSKTYEITGTVTGWNASGDSAVFSITDDTTAAGSANASSLAHGANFVWSDRSATSHTTITTDWIGGYLLKDLSSDAYSYTY